MHLPTARAAVILTAELAPIKRLLSETGFSRGFVRRFVAGETVGDAMQTARQLQRKHIRTAFDLLGENVGTEAKASRAADEYVRVLDAAQSAGLDDVYLSVKLSALGMDVGDQIAARNLRRLLEAAEGTGAFVRVDMEGSAYTGRTLSLVQGLHAEFPHIGTVLQSALRRTDADMEALIKAQISVRLVKGAYAEPANVAYPRKADVDAAYIRQMERLLRHGTRPAIASHDEDILRAAKRFVRTHAVPNDAFEFQMLLGIRRDLQEGLASEGYRVRAYVPFGTQWYPYFVRRLAERPANIGFIARALLHR